MWNGSGFINLCNKDCNWLAWSFLLCSIYRLKRGLPHAIALWERLVLPTATSVSEVAMNPWYVCMGVDTPQLLDRDIQRLFIQSGYHRSISMGREWRWPHWIKRRSISVSSDCDPKLAITPSADAPNGTTSSICTIMTAKFSIVVSRVINIYSLLITRLTGIADEISQNIVALRVPRCSGRSRRPLRGGSIAPCVTPM